MSIADPHLKNALEFSLPYYFFFQLDLCLRFYFYREDLLQVLMEQNLYSFPCRFMAKTRGVWGKLSNYLINLYKGDLIEKKKNSKMEALSFKQ